MIGKLRKKFIAVSVLSTFIVLSVIISGIHVMNYHRIEIDVFIWNNNKKIDTPTGAGCLIVIK